MSQRAVSRVSEHCTAFVQLPGGWFMNNAGWVTGTDHTLVVDTAATEARSRCLLAEVERAVGSGTSLITALTHAHGDHAHGARLMTRGGGQVLATAAAAAGIATGPHTFPTIFSFAGWGDITPPAQLTPVSETMEIDLGGTTAQLVPVPGTAHTDGDLVVWVPSDGVLFSGDLIFSGVTPLALSGSVFGWLDALDWLADFGAAWVVPGHGPVTGDPGAQIDAVRGYLHWLIDAVGGTGEPDFDALEQQARARFAGWLDAERHAANLRIAYAESRGQPCPLDTALAAMRRSAGGAIELEL